MDTSVAIDGRIIDVVRAGFMHGRMLVPAPVLGELQGLADAGDDVRRAKGRRGLEVLETLRRESGVDVEVLDDEVPAVPEVDAKLVRICLDRGAALLTLDTNLAKVASLAGVRVMNLHALALALRPPVSAGDEVGRAAAQGRQGAGPGGRLPRRRHDGGRRAVPRRDRPGEPGPGDQRAHHRQRADGVRQAGGGGRCDRDPVVAAVVPAAGRGAAPRRRRPPRRCTCSAASRCWCTRCAPSRPARSTWSWSPRRPGGPTRCAALLAGAHAGAELLGRRRRPRPAATRCALALAALPAVGARWCWCTTRPARSCRARWSTPWWPRCGAARTPWCPGCR